MTVNGGKCHFMCLGKVTGNETFTFKTLVMRDSKEQTIPGATIDNKLTFKNYIEYLSRNASKK